jgi:CHASE1-domain containing sensor protein
MISIEIRRLLLRYRVASVLTLVLGIALSTLVFFTVESRDRTNLRLAFDDAATNVESAINLGLQRSLDEVNSVGALFDSSNITNRTQFAVFAKELLATSRRIQALEWIPLVPSAMRDNYEKAAQDAFPGFKFTERKAQGQMIREGARDEYFPVYFVEPEAANRAAIGFDLGSNAVRLEALKKARDTGQIVATGRITLIQETATQYGFLLFRPVYRSGLPHEATEQRHDNLLGFALGVFRISDVIEAAAGHLQPAGISAAIYDDSAPASERFLAAWPAATRDQTSLNGQTQAKPELRRIESLDIGGRHWKVVLTPTTQFYRSGPSQSSWVALLVGLMISILMVAYI